MWSRTVTVNTALALAVRDRVADGRQGSLGELRHDVGQLVELRLAGDERVERGVPQELERERQAICERAARGASRGDDSDLARADPEPARVECRSEREPNVGVAVPAELDDGAFGGEQLERALETGGGRARMHDEITAAVGFLRRRELDVEPSRDVHSLGVDVDEGHAHSGQPAQKPRDTAA